MPYGLPTMLDLAKTKDNDPVVGLIEENIKVMPEFGLFPSRQISKTSYRTIIRTGYPTSAFRAANSGQRRSKSAFENRITECFIIDTPIAADKQVADAWEPGGAPEYQTIESEGVLIATSRRVATSIYYGNSAVSVAAGLGDAKGFPGLVDSYDATGHSVNATGSTALTSVWAIKLGIKDVHLVFGGNSVLTMLPTWRIETAYDASGNPYTAYMNNLAGWIGLNVSTINTVVRIYNIGTDTNKGMTDSLGQQALELFPAQVYPDYFIMNRRSRRQLKQSRVAVSTGQGWNANSVPLPSDIEGIPILITDALSNAETF